MRRSFKFSNLQFTKFFVSERSLIDEKNRASKASELQTVWTAWIGSAILFSIKIHLNHLERKCQSHLFLGTSLNCRITTGLPSKVTLKGETAKLQVSKLRINEYNASSTGMLPIEREC